MQLPSVALNPYSTACTRGQSNRESCTYCCADCSVCTHAGINSSADPAIILQSLCCSAVYATCQQLLFVLYGCFAHQHRPVVQGYSRNCMLLSVACDFACLLRCTESAACVVYSIYINSLIMLTCLPGLHNATQCCATCAKTHLSFCPRLQIDSCRFQLC